MAAAINYASVLVADGVTLTLGDATRTAPVNSQVVFTSPDGGMCERFTITPLATTTATVLRFWLFDGVNYDLFFEVPIAPLTVTLGAAVPSTVISAVDYPQMFPKIVPTGSSIKCSLNDAQTGVKVVAEGGGC